MGGGLERKEWLKEEWARMILKEVTDTCRQMCTCSSVLVRRRTHIISLWSKLAWGAHDVDSGMKPKPALQLWQLYTKSILCVTLQLHSLTRLLKSIFKHHLMRSARNRIPTTLGFILDLVFISIFHFAECELILADPLFLPLLRQTEAGG